MQFDRICRFLLVLAVPCTVASFQVASAGIVGTYTWGAPELIIDAPVLVGGVVWDDPVGMGSWDFQSLAPNHVRIHYVACCNGPHDHIAKFDLRIAVDGYSPLLWAPGPARIWIRGWIGGGGFFNEMRAGSGTGVPIGGGELVFTGSGEFLLTTYQTEPAPFGFSIDIGSFTSLAGQAWTHEVRIDQIGIVAATEVESPVPVVFGESWDGVSLQEILDAEYGSGAIDVATDYEGYLPGDGDPAWWQDLGVDNLLVREIAGFEHANTMGWYVETLSGVPAIDGVGDGVIFEGPASAGAEVLVEFPADTRFGFYLNPNGPNSSYHAPEPEMFFTNRSYNDLGPSGLGPLHPPTDGDVQCLVFNITHLRGGTPTYVLAWEDLDSGANVRPVWDPTGTDNDFNDLVVEISACSPVEVEVQTWGAVKSRYDE